MTREQIEQAAREWFRGSYGADTSRAVIWQGVIDFTLQIDHQAREECIRIMQGQITEPGLSDNPAYIRFEPSHAMVKKIVALIRATIKAKP